jgi:hypothetical protein
MRFDGKVREEMGTYRDITGKYHKWELKATLAPDVQKWRMWPRPTPLTSDSDKDTEC